MILFNALLILSFGEIFAQEYKEECQDDAYIRSLKGGDLFTLVADCLIDGLILKFKYPEKHTPFQSVYIYPVTEEDCAPSSYVLHGKKELVNAIFSCLLRGYDVTDEGLFDEEKLLEIVRHNANKHLARASIDYEGGCGKEFTDEYTINEMISDNCFIIELNKHFAKAEVPKIENNATADDGIGILEKLSKQVSEILQKIQSLTDFVVLQAKKNEPPKRKFSFI